MYLQGENNMELRPYQKQDLEWYLTHASTGNFSEQRTGKTPSVCVALGERKPRRALVVCPATLLYVWKHEIEKWSGLSAHVVESTDFDFKAAPRDVVYIINYEKLRGTKKNQTIINNLVKWKPDAVIVDEAHRMKSRDSLTFLNLRKLRRAEWKIALTGTPSTNHPWDVWGILNWLFPDIYTSYWGFINTYFEQTVLWIAGEPKKQPSTFKSGMDRVLQANLDIYCIQHKRKEVMQWLQEDNPPTIVKLPCTPYQKKALDDLMNFFEHKHVVTKTILDNLIRVRQVCASPEILDLKGSSPKIDWLLQYIKDYPEKSILVFSNSKKFLKLIANKLPIPHDTICGDVSPKRRIDIVRDFQKGEIKLLLLQTQACKEGLTLDEADVSIFLDTYPPASDYAQAKDRMVATVPERSKEKEIIHVMMDGTYDEQLYKLVEKNTDEIAIINDYKNYIKGGKE